MLSVRRRNLLLISCLVMLLVSCTDSAVKSSRNVQSKSSSSAEAVGEEITMFNSSTEFCEHFQEEFQSRYGVNVYGAEGLEKDSLLGAGEDKDSENYLLNSADYVCLVNYDGPVASENPALLLNKSFKIRGVNRRGDQNLYDPGKQEAFDGDECLKAFSLPVQLKLKGVPVHAILAEKDECPFISNPPSQNERRQNPPSPPPVVNNPNLPSDGNETNGDGSIQDGQTQEPNNEMEPQGGLVGTGNGEGVASNEDLCITQNYVDLVTNQRCYRTLCDNPDPNSRHKNVIVSVECEDYTPPVPSTGRCHKMIYRDGPQKELICTDRVCPDPENPYRNVRTHLGCVEEEEPANADDSTLERTESLGRESNESATMITQ